MLITIKLFARAEELAGTDTLEVALPDDATVQTLKDQLQTDHPALAPLVPHLHVSIGTDYATDTTPITPNDEVACFPPVSGG